MANGKGALIRGLAQCTPRRSRKEVRSILGVAFNHAIEVSGQSQASVARWLGKGSSTIRRWQRGSHPVDVEAIMMSPRLWPHFLRCLVSLEHKAGAVRLAKRQQP